MDTHNRIRPGEGAEIVFFEDWPGATSRSIFARITVNQARTSILSRIRGAVSYLFGCATLDVYLNRSHVARLAAHHKVQAVRQVDPEAEALLATPTAAELNG